MKRFRIPTGLDMDALLIKFPVEFKGFKIDKVYWICNALYKGSLSLDKKTNKHPLKADPYYVPLSSDILGYYLGREYYMKIIRWMIAADIIECDNHYLSGVVSLGYRFTEKYRNAFSMSVEISDNILHSKNKIFKSAEKNELQSSVIGALREWIKGVTIDKKAACDSIEQMRELGMKKAKKAEQKLKIIYKYNNACSTVDMFDDDISEYCHQDSKGRRLHTILTQLPKYLRPFVRYNGKELAQTDISNSQLFFSIYLLNLKDCDNDEIFRLIQDYSNNTQPTTSYSIMSPVFNQNSATIKEFVELVTSGRIYDYLVSLMEKQSRFFKPNLTYEMKRNQIKSLLIAQINGDYSVVDKNARQYDFSKIPTTTNHNLTKNNSALKNLRLYTGQNQILWKTFNTEFPEIAHIYRKIKLNNNADLSYILQRVESSAILDTACLYIASKCPETPIFTLHDCIISTVDCIEKIDTLMKESIAKWIGYAPKSKINLWSEYWKLNFIQKEAS